MRGFSIVLAAVVAVFVAGCHGPYRASTYAPGTTSLEHAEKVIFADNFHGRIKLVSTSSAVLPDGRLEVYAEFENETGSNLAVQAQTQFKNIAGQLSTDETNWQTIIMPPHSITTYRAASMNNQAKDYLIRLKWEKKH